MRVFEEVRIGETMDLGSHLFTAEEIVDFARKYDWQSFHVDAEAAKKSHFGALCASGWHTAAIWSKLYVAANRPAQGSNAPADVLGPSPGFEDLKWLKPVYAGDTIRYSLRIRDKRDLASRPGWGLVSTRNEGVNQRGELAFAFTGHVFVRKRGPA